MSDDDQANVDPDGADRFPGASAQTLAEIADNLEARGVDVEELRDLQEEMEALEHPPGLVRRLSERARRVAKQQWENLVGELEESQEAMQLIRARMTSDRELDDAEKDKIRSQLMDLVRIFPAGLIVAANSVLPVPGTSMLTPWLLVKLGLMPSRWRESHLLHQLQRQQELLRRTGHATEASRLGVLRDRLEHEAERRDAIQREARLLTHWDANDNGVWDPDERKAYGQECEKVRDLVGKHASRKRWFLEHEGTVFGPSRLSHLEFEASGAFLVCYDGRTGWVALSDVLDD